MNYKRNKNFDIKEKIHTPIWTTHSYFYGFFPECLVRIFSGILTPDSSVQNIFFFHFLHKIFILFLNRVVLIWWLPCLLSISDIPNEIPNDGKLWVVLVAGSSGYYNYRHQADVCHAYQVVHSHGVPVNIETKVARSS